MALVIAGTGTGCGCPSGEYGWGCKQSSVVGAAIDDEDNSRDMTTEIAQSAEQTVEVQAQKLASQFSLSLRQGRRIAQTLHDFNGLKDRSDDDIADFANRLYGVNPKEILSAAAKAQLGNNTELNALIREAAVRFETTPENMKNIVKTLHKGLLDAQGIDL